jgi:RNA polymerase sigma factor (sigma-70 family)
MDEEPTVPALVQAAEHGDEAAWRALVDRYTPLVASVVQRYRLRGSDAEDVVQTVWLRLVEHLGDLREPRALPMWIITITRNESLRLIRTSQRTQPFDPTDERETPTVAEQPDLDEALVRTQRHEALLAAFAELPDQQRELLLLLVAEPPVPYAEISQRLGIPVGSIGPTRARAIRRLRECPLIAEWQETGTGFSTKGGGGHDRATVGRR